MPSHCGWSSIIKFLEARIRPDQSTTMDLPLPFYGLTLACDMRRKNFPSYLFHLSKLTLTDGSGSLNIGYSLVQHIKQK